MKRSLLPVLCLLMLTVQSVFGAAEHRVTVPLGNSPATGPENAPVTIVEFIDFQ